MLDSTDPVSYCTYDYFDHDLRVIVTEHRTVAVIKMVPHQDNLCIIEWFERPLPDDPTMTIDQLEDYLQQGECWHKEVYTNQRWVFDSRSSLHALTEMHPDAAFYRKKPERYGLAVFAPIETGDNHA